MVQDGVRNGFAWSGEAGRAGHGMARWDKDLQVAAWMARQARYGMVFHGALIRGELWHGRHGEVLRGECSETWFCSAG